MNIDSVNLLKMFLFSAKEPVQATGEDTDAVHRRFMKEPAANIKDGVTEPSKVSKFCLFKKRLEHFYSLSHTSSDRRSLKSLVLFI